MDYGALTNAIEHVYVIEALFQLKDCTLMEVNSSFVANIML